MILLVYDDTFCCCGLCYRRSACGESMLTMLSSVIQRKCLAVERMEKLSKQGRLLKCSFVLTNGWASSHLLNHGLPFSHRYRGTPVAVKRLHEPVARLRSDLVLGVGRETINHDTTNHDGRLRPKLSNSGSDWGGYGHSFEGEAGKENSLNNSLVYRRTFGVLLKCGRSTQQSASTWSSYIRCSLMCIFNTIFKDSACV